MVDDDRQICEGIEQGINWSEIGIGEVKSAFNGIEALEIFKRDFPEIVLTDIRMPGMDGLELFKKIKEIRPSTKVIIISGHSDFDYLKTAIQYGAVDYELKPIRVKNLIALISKVKEDILKEKSTEDNFARYQKTYISTFMDNLLSGKITDRNIILEELEQYFGFDARGCLLLILFEADTLQDAAEDKTADYFDRLKEYFGEKPVGSSGVMLWKPNGRQALLIIRTVDSMLFQQYLNSELKRISGQINRDFEAENRATLSLGISGIGKVSGVARLYRQASEALEHKFYTGRRSVNFYQNLTISAVPYSMASAAMGKLSRAIGDFDLNLAVELIEDEFTKIKTGQSDSKKSITGFGLELMKFLNSTLKSKGFEIIDQYDEKLKAYDNLSRKETLEDLKAVVLDYYSSVFVELKDEKEVSNNRGILKAVEYIKRNYDKDLTVEVVAQFIGKSPNYFSHVFKKEMKMSFTEYLNRMRIRKARELILSTDKLVYEICMEVGYQDYAYFAQLFKKFENCTPTEIKNNTQQKS